MSGGGRWIILPLLILAATCLNHASSQERGPKLSITSLAASPGSTQTSTRPRTPEQWIKPLPHRDGNDDPGLHGLGLVIPDSLQRYWRTHAPHFTYTAAVLPTSVDWSVYDSPVKAQGRCGACWAFAAVAAVENAARRDDLSEQVLISCSGAGNCAGGYYEEALNYIRLSGVPAEACAPYTETNGDCASKSPNPPFLVHLSSGTISMWGDIARLEDLKGALQNGPVIVRMVVYLDFDAYTGGIYHHTAGSFKGYHAVLVEGYNDDERCFKAKNSWGTSWGEGGYFRISYDDLTNEVQFGGYAAQVTGVRTEYPQATDMTSPNDRETGRADRFALQQNYPNPFNPVTTIKYTVGGTRDAGRGAREVGTGNWGLGVRVKLAIYDLLGREVATLVDETQLPGSYEVNFSASVRNTTGLPSGMYIYQLRAGDLVQSRRMALMR